MQLKLIHLVALLLLVVSCKNEKKEVVVIGNTEEKELSVIDKHDKAVHVMDGIWMRDPFIILHPDGYYYLSCTRQNNNFPKGKAAMQFWRSTDLLNWEDLGVRWEAENSVFGKAILQKGEENNKAGMIWAPEIHFINNKWVIVNTSNQGMANLMISEGAELKGPFTEPFGAEMGRHHDPSIFMDGNQPWLVDKIAEVTPLKKDFSGFDGDPVKIGPSDRKMGHEGAYIIKVEDKYVLFGTAWSTDTMRHGTYNLYYCVADKLIGPYDERKFAGRFLGHGTPFKDKNGNWWCTAFYNANKPPLNPEEAKTMELSDTAYTINKQGLTLVPMDINYEEGTVKVTVLDENYALPGAEEVQKF
jgi:arylsulfatase